MIWPQQRIKIFFSFSHNKRYLLWEHLQRYMSLTLLTSTRAFSCHEEWKCCCQGCMRFVAWAGICFSWYNTNLPFHCMFLWEVLQLVSGFSHKLSNVSLYDHQYRNLSFAHCYWNKQKQLPSFSENRSKILCFPKTLSDRSTLLRTKASLFMTFLKNRCLCNMPHPSLNSPPKLHFLNTIHIPAATTGSLGL